MSAFAPADSRVVWAGAALLVLTLALGFAVSRLASPRFARIAAWLLVALAFAGAERLTAGEPAGFRMLGILGALLYGMKAVVSVEERIATGTALSPLRWLAFAAGWPGMRPSLFATLGSRPLPGSWRLMRRGLVRLALGALLFFAARRAWATGSVILATVLALPALSLMLHFGIFNLLAGGWRLLGARCDALFRAPLRSRSLTEFWGRRWNLAFSEMTALGIYRPLEPRVGRPAAMATAFLASGLLHEIAISLPVNRGFGLPLSYFALHGLLRLVETRLERAGHPVWRHAWLGRAWTVFWLVLPLPILFHRPFLAGIVWPLLDDG
ncbi:MAG TPA: MBOAT family protein [Thermoanaerobaculia bacterium]|jgi:alginate O-acetyltransferase complex protein AlgI|nr:MBOAT family protein [Thermoanaerobaculia bacterium]